MRTFIVFAVHCSDFFQTDLDSEHDDERVIHVGPLPLRRQLKTQSVPRVPSKVEEPASAVAQALDSKQTTQVLTRCWGGPWTTQEPTGMRPTEFSALLNGRYRGQ